MTEIVKELTEYQKSVFGVYVDRWTKIGLSTESMNFEKAKEAFEQSCTLIGYESPKKYITARSPIEAIDLAQKHNPNLTKKEILNSTIYGAHDASWLAFYQYFLEVFGFECCEKLLGFMNLAKHAGWVTILDDLIIIQDKPEYIKFDDQNRLHCEDGPSIRYRDGFSVYSWHGVHIPGDWIENKKSLAPETALTWQNIEQRRAACEILGWNNILKKLDAVVVDEDEDPEVGTLLEVEIPEIGKEKFLRVLCGTKREFALPVPPEMETALQANAWTFGFDQFEFKKPEIRT